MWFALGYAYIGELMFFSFILAGRCRPAALGQKRGQKLVFAQQDEHANNTRPNGFGRNLKARLHLLLQSTS